MDDILHGRIYPGVSCPKAIHAAVAELFGPPFHFNVLFETERYVPVCGDMRSLNVKECSTDGISKYFSRSRILPSPILFALEIDPMDSKTRISKL